ncbi:MAG: peptide deformylase [Gammaproteobacteria bacterium]|nr:peptide deformylase [Gammaproteobacteria bacterium]
MAVRKVLRMGDPLLWRVAEPVANFHDPELRALIDDMFDTMDAMNGAGLAAPQIGVSRRVVIFGIESNPRYPNIEPVPMTVLINPVIEPLDGATVEGWEGCLSVPGMRGLVPRYSHIRYSGYDQHGIHFEREVRDFHARVVQHECDHLDGVLYPMRIRDMRNFGFQKELMGEETDGE